MGSGVAMLSSYLTADAKQLLEGGAINYHLYGLNEIKHNKTYFLFFNSDYRMQIVVCDLIAKCVVN